MVENHYRWDFIGLSTDSKPTISNEKVTDGSTFYESDTSKLYVWCNDQWYEKENAGGGGGGMSLTYLTSADLNYPESNPTSIRLDLLNEGWYQVAKDTDPTVQIYAGNQNIGNFGGNYPALFLVTRSYNTSGYPTNKRCIFYFSADSANLYSIGVNDSGTGTASLTNSRFLKISDLDNSLTSTSTSKGLTSYGAKLLNDKFGGVSIVKISQSDYNNLSSPDANTLYFIY